VPQEEGPAYLAACDVLVATHVPNPDGSKFFGSPTKLFEYMATGRGIVASRLGQIAEVLEHGRTALLTEPGSPDALAEALARMVHDERLRAELGHARARRLCGGIPGRAYAAHPEKLQQRYGATARSLPNDDGERQGRDAKQWNTDPCARPRAASSQSAAFFGRLRPSVTPRTRPG
jgi:glycosyltransferase involved in cell wall biosynthesis